MNRIAAVLVAALAPLACGRSVPEETPPGASGAAVTGQPVPDSLTLERTRCFGLCPAYRLSIARSGRVHFASRNPGDSARTAADSIAPGAVEALFGQATLAGLYQLPDRIADADSLCSMRATDHPSVVVTSFGPGGAVKRVDHYTGCYVPSDSAGGQPRLAAALARLRAFEDAVDSAAGSARWVRPARGK